MGSFVLHSDVSRPAVFLAGGIVITPFLSMLSSVPIEKHHPPVFLFYANRYIEDAAFIDTLCNLEMSTGNFHFVPTFIRIARQARADGRGQPVLSTHRCSRTTSVICKIRSITLPDLPAWRQGLNKPWLSSLSLKKTFVQRILQVIERKGIGMVHSAVPLVLALQSWRPERNYKDALSPVAMKTSWMPIS
jgi:Oxidoreductase NAD-binding domain